MLHSVIFPIFFLFYAGLVITVDDLTVCMDG